MYPDSLCVASLARSDNRMHSALIAACFLLLILVPCLVAMKSSSKEGKTGNSGEHDLPKAPSAARGHSPSRLREAADAMAARKQAKLDAENGVVITSTAQRPSRIRMAVDAALSRPVVDETSVSSSGDKPSRIRMVTAALTQRRSKGPVPMADGDPGSKKQSIKDLRAKHGAKMPRA